MRNTAAKKIASIILLVCLLLFLVGFLIFTTFYNLFGKEGSLSINLGGMFDWVGVFGSSDDDDGNDASGPFDGTTASKPLTDDSSSDKASTSSASSASTSTSTSSQNSTTKPSSTISPSSSNTSTSSSATSSKEEEKVTFVGSTKNTETIGNCVSDLIFVENNVYGFKNDDFVSYTVNSSGKLSASTTLISNYRETINRGEYIYDHDCVIFDGKIYWVAFDSKYDRYKVVYSCNLDGTGLKESSENYYGTDCFNFQVASDGVYISFWNHDGKVDTNVLQKLDLDLNRVATLSGAIDFQLIGDKIYYISGDDNCGYLYSADRKNFENQKRIEEVSGKYEELKGFGEYLVLSPTKDGYGGSMHYDANDLLVFDTAQKKAVYELQDVADVQAVSDYNGGMVVYETKSGHSYAVTLQTGQTCNFYGNAITFMGKYLYYKTSILSETYYRKEIDDLY